MKRNIEMEDTLKEREEDIKDEIKDLTSWDEKEISYNKFKNETRHKKVKFVFFPTDKTKESKEFKTDKFYCNKDYRLKMYSMPKFMLSFGGEFFKQNDKNYIFVSEYGTTVFKVEDD